MTSVRIARSAAALAALAAFATLAAGAAGAQAPRRDSLTLYEGADYRGASVTLYGDLADLGSTGFSTRARSAQVIGQWRLCAGGGFRNGCQTVQGNLRDLGVLGLPSIGSAQRLSGTPAPAYTPRYQEPAAPAPLPAPVARPVPAPVQAPPQAYGPPPSRAVVPAPQPAPYEPAPYPQGYVPPYEAGYSDARPGYGDGFAPYAPLPPALDAPPSAVRAPEAASPRPSAAPRPAPRPLPAPVPAPIAAEPALPPTPYDDMSASGGVDGVRATFFPRPFANGYDLSASGIGAADAFCRSQGLGVALYFDSTQKARSSVDERGQPVGSGPILRDVLCRRF